MSKYTEKILVLVLLVGSRVKFEQEISGAKFWWMNFGGTIFGTSQVEKGCSNTIKCFYTICPRRKTMRKLWWKLGKNWWKSNFWETNSLCSTSLPVEIYNRWLLNKDNSTPNLRWKMIVWLLPLNCFVSRVEVVLGVDCWWCVDWPRDWVYFINM